MIILKITCFFYFISKLCFLWMLQNSMNLLKCYMQVNSRNLSFFRKLIFKLKILTPSKRFLLFYLSEYFLKLLCNFEIFNYKKKWVSELSLLAYQQQLKHENYFCVSNFVKVYTQSKFLPPNRLFYWSSNFQIFILRYFIRKLRSFKFSEFNGNPRKIKN